MPWFTSILKIDDDPRGYKVENNVSGRAQSASFNDQFRICEKCGYRFHVEDGWDRFHHWYSCKVKSKLFGRVRRIVAPLKKVKEAKTKRGKGAIKPLTK